MTRNLLTMLDYEANRRPDLAILVRTIDQLNDAAIDEAPVPLPWMRNALRALKQQHESIALAAWLDGCVQYSHVADPIGEMRCWTGDDCYIKVGRGQLEIRHGQLLWLDATGGWIDTIRLSVIDPQLTSQTGSCGRVTRSQYMTAVRDRANGLIVNTDTIDSGRQGVRFFRPP